MAYVLETVQQIVIEICQRLNDPNFTRYADSGSNYTGRAMDHFFRAVRTIIESPKRYGLTKADFPGIVIGFEVAVETGGVISFSNLIGISGGEPLKILNVRTDPDSANTQVAYTFKEINPDYPAYAERTENTDSAFYEPKIDTTYDIGWYVTDTTDGTWSKKVIQLFPDDTATVGDYVFVDYISDLDYDNIDNTTQMYYDTSGGYFSRKFIDKALDMATRSLIEERDFQ